MDQGWRARLREHAKDRPLLALTFLAAVAATAAAASPGLPQTGRLASREPTLDLATTEPAPLRLVWAGVDLDGDGAADFANPTGKEPREEDAYGQGAFGAPRDGGSRRHEGVDFMAEAGQVVVAPISGFVTRIGYAYPGDMQLKFVELVNPALRHSVRVFYVDPTVQVGQSVALGSPIGTAHSLQERYPGGMTDHVHLEITGRRGRSLDAEALIVARYEPVREGKARAAPARNTAETNRVRITDSR